MPSNQPFHEGEYTPERPAPSAGQLKKRLSVSRRVVWCRGSIFLLTAAITLNSPNLTSAASGPEPTDAFTLPSSNLVFKVTASFPAVVEREAGFEIRPATRQLRKVSFEAREGALVVFDPTPADLGGRIGVMLTRDRDEAGPGVSRRAFKVHTFRIERDPYGGEKMTVLRPHTKANYHHPAHVKHDGIEFWISVRDDRFGQFDDEDLLHDLTSALERDPNALSGLYDLVYSLYGPGAAGCCLVDGVWVCATNISGCDGGWSY